jgi:hypothetical protein
MSYNYPYMIVVQGHLKDAFEKNPLFTDEMVIYIANETFKKWLTKISLDCGYIPVFSSQDIGKHVIVSFIKRFIPC